MSPISNRETALLILLAEEPMHAYRIEKEIGERDMRFWTEISMSSIYKLLNKLSSRKLISKSRKDAENGITKNVFALTSAGRKALEHKIRELISEPEHLRWQIDLATSHLAVLPRNDVLACLSRYRKSLLERLECYGRLEGFLAEQQCPPYSKALATRPQYLLKAEISWIDDYIVEIKKMREWNE